MQAAKTKRSLAFGTDLSGGSIERVILLDKKSDKRVEIYYEKKSWEMERENRDNRKFLITFILIILKNWNGNTKQIPKTKIHAE